MPADSCLCSLFDKAPGYNVREIKSHKRLILYFQVKCLTNIVK